MAYEGRRNQPNFGTINTDSAFMCSGNMAATATCVLIIMSIVVSTLPQNSKMPPPLSCQPPPPHTPFLGMQQVGGGQRV